MSYHTRRRGTGSMIAIRNFWAIAVSTIAAVLMVVVTIVPAASASEGCTNEARRTEQASTSLPDCRAYEIVTQPYQPSPSYSHYFEGVAPLEPTGFIFPEMPAEVPKTQAEVATAVDGDAALFGSNEPNSQADGVLVNLSRRGSGGWVGENIEPPQSRHAFLCLVAGYTGFSQNLDKLAFLDGKSETESGKEESYDKCGYDEPRLVAGEPEEAANLFVRDTASGSFQLVNVTPPGVKEYDPWLEAMSADGSHVVFSSRALLTADAPPDEQQGSGSTEYCDNEFGDIYVWSAGAVRLLTVLPDGAPARGTLAGAHPFAGGCHVTPAQSAGFTDSVAADGERILFYAGGGFEFGPKQFRIRSDAPYIHGGLYLREHPGAEESSLHECTVAEQAAEPERACSLQIDVPAPGAPAGAKAGGGQFRWANAETTKIFFTDEEKLTESATAEAGKPDLYEYDFDRPAGERLTDLTAGTSEPADVLGVVGASQDGSYVYFAAAGDLTGAQQNSHGDSALAPAQGSGVLSGVAEGAGEVSHMSNRVTGVSVTSGEFHVGQEVTSPTRNGIGELFSFIHPASTIAACVPDCSAPSELILSRNAIGDGSVELTGLGSSQITGVSASSGSFHAGMAISGAGILPGTWIEQAGAGTLVLSRGVDANGTQALSASAANLYLRHAGATTFVAALPTDVDHCDWTAYCLTSRVSQNGAYVVFDSFAELTGYDNHPAHHPEACEPLTQTAQSPCMQIFRYAAEEGGSQGELTCASCAPSGAPPASEFAWSVIEQPQRKFDEDYNMQASHNVSNGGEVFFDTMESLVPADGNETWDVYQYDGGEGAGAKLHLISTGKSVLPSYFDNATPDGANVFFVTSESLLGADTRSDYDIYDARVNGGFAAQDEPVQRPPCGSIEGCRSPLTEPPAEFSVASATLLGPGNLVSKPERPAVKGPAKQKTKQLTRKQKLERALRTCVKRYRHKPRQRRRCERQAHARYGVKANHARAHHGSAGK